MLAMIADYAHAQSWRTGCVNIKIEELYGLAMMGL
jgi:hypothetical protein